MGLIEGKSVQVTGVFLRNRARAVRVLFPARQSATVLLLPAVGAPA